MPPNDPQWGKKNNEGPPDLDEILRKLQQKISGLLGFRSRPPGTPPSGGGNMGNAVGGGVVLVIFLIVGVWLASGFYIVDEGRRGVVLRLGKYLETTTPGPRWHVPYPIESVEVVNVAQVRTVEVGYRGNPKNKQPQEALMLTDDENIVDVQFAVQYTLKSPEEYLFNNRNPDDNVLQAAETAVREVVGKSKMDFVLSQGRSEVASRVKVIMQGILDRYKTGISITTVNLQGASAPEQVQPAFEDVVRAQQDRERFKNEGQAYANDVVPKARGIAARLIEEANGYRASVVTTLADQKKLLDELMRRYTDQHPDVISTKRLIAQLEDEKKQQLDARRKAAAENPSKFTPSTNPVFQKIKMSLSDAEANIAALRARLAESEARLAQLKTVAGRAPQVEAEMAQLNRDYAVLRRNYEQLVARRESVSMAEDVDSLARMADFRIIDPPRISPKAVFPNRLALVPLVLAIALAVGMAASLVVSQILPTFHDARQLRSASKRTVLGTISLQSTQPIIHQRRRANFAFGGGVASLLLLYGSWITWAALAARA